MGNSLAELVLDELIAINIAASIAILVVIALRKPAQKLFGAGRASWLWLAPLAAGIACLLPRPEAPLPPLPAPAPMPMFVPPPMPEIVETPVFVEPVAAPIDWPPLLVAVWLGGAALFLIAMLWRQARMVARFGKLTRGADGLMRGATAEGPAVIGFLRTLLVVPADFEARYSEREREMVVAHERAHIAAQHTRINTLLVVLQALGWFNPLAHIAARLIRADQEFACDAAVAEKFPGEKRTYGEALLKTQLGLAPPMGCAWPSRSANFLEARVRMLAAKPAGRKRRLAGAGVLLAAALAGGAAVWAAQPEEEPQENWTPNRTAISRLLEKPADAQLEAGLAPADRTRSALSLIAATKPIALLHTELPKARNIPEGQIVDTAVAVRLPDGDVLGPYLVRNSLPTGMTTAESVFNDRFAGVLMADIADDGSLVLGFALSIDRQPLLVRDLRLRPDETVTVVLEGGYAMKVTAGLRPITQEERRRRGDRVQPAALEPQPALPTPPAPIPQSAPAPQQERGGLVPIRHETPPAQATLRVVAVKTGALEVRSANGTKFVSRQFSPGQSYAPRTGSGFTISASDGGAFEWRLGERVLGLVGESGRPVVGLNVDQAVRGGLTPIRFQEQPPAQTARDGPEPAPAPWLNPVLICDDWTSIFGGDPLVQFRQLKRTTPIRVTFEDSVPKPDISAAAAAFPREHFPAGLAEGAEGSDYRSRPTRDTASYRVSSKTLIDTFTFAGLEGERPSATWHRVRISPDGPHQIFMAGSCRK